MEREARVHKLSAAAACGPSPLPAPEGLKGGSRQPDVQTAARVQEGVWGDTGEESDKDTQEV